jgi:hypothetical protein
LNTELEILKVYSEIHLQTNRLSLFFIDGKTARILLQMKYQFENDLGILNYLSTNEKSAIVLTQPEMELKPLIAGSSIYNQQFEI